MAVTQAPRTQSGQQQQGAPQGGQVGGNQQVAGRNRAQTNAQKPDDVLKAKIVEDGNGELTEKLMSSITGVVVPAETKMKGDAAKTMAGQSAGFDLEKHAQQTVETHIDGLAGTAQQKKDVKAHSAALAQGTVTAGIKKLADTKVTEVFQSLDTNGALAAGRKIYTDAKVSASKGLEKESARLATEAKKVMDPLVKTAIAAAGRALDVALKNPALQAQLKTDLKATTAQAVTTDPRANQELTGRKGEEANVGKITGDLVKAALDKDKEKLNAYLEDKIGANGAGYFRSQKLKDFRGAIKAGGRDQARQDIKAQTDGAMQDGKGEAQAQYTRMVANDVSYDKTKDVVNEHLQGLAGEATTAIWDTHKAAGKDTLTDAASAAVWGAIRDTSGDAKKKEAAAKKAGAKAIQPKDATFYAAVEKDAKKWKDQVLQKQGAEPRAPGQDVVDAASETERVKQKVSTGADDKGHNIAKQSITAASGEQALGMLGHIIDLAAPQVDSSCALEISFKVPISHGAFAEFGVKGEAEKSEKGTKVAAGIKLGAGWEMTGFAAAAHLEFFLEAMSKSTTDAVLLMQYGMYRRLADKSPTVAGVFAGKRLSEKRTDMSRGEQNETWAAMVEERSLMGEDNKESYVHSGMSGDVGLKVDAGLLKGDASLSHKRGTKIDSTSLGADAGKLKHEGSKAEREQEAERASTRKKTGRDTSRTEVAVNGEFNALEKLRFGFGGKFYKEMLGTEAEYGGELSFKVPFDLGGVAPPALANTIAGAFVPAATSMLKTAFNGVKGNKSGKNEDSKAGMGADVAEDALHGIDNAVALSHGNIMGGIETHIATATPFGDHNPVNSASDNVNHALASHLHTDYDSSSTNALNATSQLEVTLGLKYAGGKWKPSVSFAVTKKMEINVGGFGAGMKVAVEKKKKLLDHTFNDDPPPGTVPTAPTGTPPVPTTAKQDDAMATQKQKPALPQRTKLIG